MKVHYITRMCSDGKFGDPACDPVFALVRKDSNGTKYRRKVTCGNCKRTNVFKNVRKRKKKDGCSTPLALARSLMGGGYCY